MMLERADGFEILGDNISIERPGCCSNLACKFSVGRIHLSSKLATRGSNFAFNLYVAGIQFTIL